MKKTLCVLLIGLIFLGLTGSSSSNVKDTDAYEMQLEMITLKNKWKNLVEY